MKIKKCLNVLLFTSTIILSGIMQPVLSKEKSYTITNYNNLEIVSQKQELPVVEFKITHSSDFNIDLLKGNILISSQEETQKIVLSSKNYVIQDNDSFFITVPISTANLNEEINITLNTEYRGDKQSSSKTILIKEDDFVPSVVSYIQDDINIYKDVVLSFNWAVTNLTSEQLQKLTFEVYLDDYLLTASAKGNSIIASMPAVRLSSEDLKAVNSEGKTFHLKFYINSENNTLFETIENVYIYNKKELLSFDFNKHYLELAKGTVNTISIKKSPSDFNCKTSYKSSDPDVAKVNEKGVIQAVETGAATITATCGTKTTKAIVKVHNDPVSIKFNSNPKFIEVGKQKLIELNVTPEQATVDYSSLLLTSSDFILASIDKNSGIITAYNEGEVEIGYTFNYQEYKETYQVIPAVKEIETSLEEWFRMQVGDTLSFTVQTLPYDITKYTSIDITSSDEDLLSINGHSITAKKSGVVRLYFTYDDIQTCVDIEIIESDDKLSDFSLNSSQATIPVGYVFDLRNVFISKGVSYEEISFSCEDNDLIKLNDLGVVTTSKQGEVLIKLSSKTTTQYFKLKIK